MAALPPFLGALFSSFGGVEFWFLIIFFREIAKLSLITARDNMLWRPKLRNVDFLGTLGTVFEELWGCQGASGGPDSEQIHCFSCFLFFVFSNFGSYCSKRAEGRPVELAS